MERMPNARPHPDHPHWTACALMDTALGQVFLARTAQGLAGVWFEGQKHHPFPLGEWPERLSPGLHDHDPLLQRAQAQIRDYLAGRRDHFELPLDPSGTPFQMAVWRALQGIDHGCATTYGQIARCLGLPQAARAVGSAVARNPLMMVVPCHRVIAQGGALKGYAAGLDRKHALLSLEGLPGVLV